MGSKRENKEWGEKIMFNFHHGEYFKAWNYIQSSAAQVGLVCMEPISWVWLGESVCVCVFVYIGGYGSERSAQKEKGMSKSRTLKWMAAGDRSKKDTKTTEKRWRTEEEEWRAWTPVQAAECQRGTPSGKPWPSWLYWEPVLWWPEHVPQFYKQQLRRLIRKKDVDLQLMNKMTWSGMLNGGQGCIRTHYPGISTVPEQAVYTYKITRKTFPAGSIFQTLPSVVCSGACPGHSRPFLDWQSRIDRPLLFPFKVNRVLNALAWLRAQMRQTGRRDKTLI